MRATGPRCPRRACCAGGLFARALRGAFWKGYPRPAGALTSRTTESRPLNRVYEAPLSWLNVGPRCRAGPFSLPSFLRCLLFAMVWVFVAYALQVCASLWTKLRRSCSACVSRVRRCDGRIAVRDPPGPAPVSGLWCEWVSSALRGLLI